MAENHPNPPSPLRGHGFERTRTGRACSCRACGHRWKLNVEDEGLHMLGASLATRRHVIKHRQNPD
jgi:hypothetical protein